MADPAKLLKQAAALYKKGRRDQARDLLMQLIEIDENNEKAWLLLSAAVDGLEDKQIALENVLTINPKNEKAQKGLALVNKKLAQIPKKSDNEPLGGSGWSDINTEVEVDTHEDSWGSYTEEPAQSSSPFTTAPAESADSDDDSGWGDLDASSVFTQAGGDTWGSSTPAEPSESVWGDTASPTPAPVNEEPVGTSWGDLDTSADPWADDNAFSAPDPGWGETPEHASAAETSPWDSTPESDPSPSAFGDSITAWDDASLDIDEPSPWGDADESTSAPASVSSPSGQPTSADYDEWIGELNLKSDSSSTIADSPASSPWGAEDSSPWDTSPPVEKSSEPSPWAQDAEVISDAWGDWGTGEAPSAEPAATKDNPWGTSDAASDKASPFSTANKSPFGEMPVDEMASSSSLGLDENPFDSPIDVSAPAPTRSPESTSSGLSFGQENPFADLLDDDDADFDLLDEEEEIESLSDAISSNAGREKRLSMASSGGQKSDVSQYWKMIPAEITAPAKSGRQLSAMLTVVALFILNLGALGWLVSQLLG